MSQQEIVLVNEEESKEQEQEREHKTITYLLKNGGKQRVKGVVDNIGPIYIKRIGIFTGRANRVMRKSNHFSERA